MEVWTWIVAYVVGFSLLQLLIYRYFRDSGPSVDAPPGSGDRHPGAVERPSREADHGDDEGEGVYCQQCGAYNGCESTYRYCKQCVAPLR